MFPEISENMTWAIILRGWRYATYSFTIGFFFLEEYCELFYALCHDHFKYWERWQHTPFYERPSLFPGCLALYFMCLRDVTYVTPNTVGPCSPCL